MEIAFSIRLGQDVNKRNVIATGLMLVCSLLYFLVDPGASCRPSFKEDTMVQLVSWKSLCNSVWLLYGHMSASSCITQFAVWLLGRCSSNLLLHVCFLSLQALFIWDSFVTEFFLDLVLIHCSCSHSSLIDLTFLDWYLKFSMFSL